MSLKFDVQDYTHRCSYRVDDVAHTTWCSAFPFQTFRHMALAERRAFTVFFEADSDN